MEASYKMNFPASRSCLWDSSATDERVDLHLTSSHWLMMYVKKTAISLAVKYHCSKVKRSPSIYSTSCLLLGQAYSNDTDDGLVLEVDRFDPGKVSSQDEQILLPTTTLPGDYIISLTVVTQPTPSMEGVMTHNMVEMRNSFKELVKQCETVTVLNPAGMASIKIVCSCDPDGPAHIGIKCGCVLIDHLISVTPIHPLPIVPTALARNLMGPHPLSAVQSRVRNGFLTMEQTRKLVLLLSSDPKVLSLPLIGVWLSGVSTPQHPVVWTACVQFTAPQSPLRDRVFSEDGHFLVLLFPSSPTHPICLQAKIGQDGCYDFHSCSCQLTNDELQTTGHISMELIPAPPTSADHTVFMTSLKESHTGDHMTSRRDETRLKSEHMIFTDALDEIVSSNHPKPTFTMVPTRPLRSNDRLLCVSILDNEGCGSSYDVQSGMGGAPLSDSTARILNQSMEKRSDSSLLCSDSVCSSSVTSHTCVNRTDLKSLQEKVEMLLQTNSSTNVGVIGCEDHVSSDGSTTSPDSSFESHMTPQPHPSLSGMTCSDSSGCGCSNTLDIQSYEDSIAQHSGSLRLEEQDCRKGEGLKTAARLPLFSQLSSPFVGESASIVTSSNLSTTNETTVTESDGQYEVYQRMMHQIQQLLAAQDDTGTRSHDPSDITSTTVNTSIQSSQQYNEYYHPQMILRIPDGLECLSTYGHTINDDSDTTILPFPRIQCSSSYYHGNDSNITMDEQAELISLKYLRRHQLISQGITLPPVVTKETELSMATQQYLQRHGLNDTSIVEQMKPYNSSNDNNHNDSNMVLDIKRLRSLPKLY